MSALDERELFTKNPYYKELHIYSDFTPFYVTIAVCTVFCAFLFLLNLICCCCSKHKTYWKDRHTGNRWLISLWTSSPHNQPPLDLTELKDPKLFQPPRLDIEVERPVEVSPPRQSNPYRFGRQQREHREEFVELREKKESDI